MNEIRRFFRGGKNRKKSRQRGKKKKKSIISSRHVLDEEASSNVISSSRTNMRENVSTYRSNPSRPSSSYFDSFPTNTKRPAPQFSKIYSQNPQSNSNYNTWASSVDNVSSIPSKYGKWKRAPPPPVPVRGPSLRSGSPVSVGNSPNSEKIYTQSSTLPLPKNASSSLFTRSSNRSRIENWLQGENSLRKGSSSSTCESNMGRSQWLATSRDEKDLAALRPKRGASEMDNESVHTFNSSMVSTSRRSVLGAAVSTWNRFTTVQLETDLNNFGDDDIDSIRSTATFSYPTPRSSTLPSQSSLSSRKALSTALFRVRFKHLKDGTNGDKFESENHGEVFTSENVDSPTGHSKMKLRHQGFQNLRPSSGLDSLDKSQSANNLSCDGENITGQISSFDEVGSPASNPSPSLSIKRIRNKSFKLDTQRDTSASEERLRGRDSNRSSSNFQLLYEIVEEDDDAIKERHPSASSMTGVIVNKSTKEHSKSDAMDKEANGSSIQYFFGEQETVSTSRQVVSSNYEKPHSIDKPEFEATHQKDNSETHGQLESLSQILMVQPASIAEDMRMSVYHEDGGWLSMDSTNEQVLESTFHEMNVVHPLQPIEQSNPNSVLTHTISTSKQSEYDSVIHEHIPSSVSMTDCNGIDSTHDNETQTHSLPDESQNDKFVVDCENNLAKESNALPSTECPNLLLHPSLDIQDDKEIMTNDFKETEKFLKIAMLDIEEDIVCPIELKAVKTTRQRSVPKLHKRNYKSKEMKPQCDSLLSSEGIPLKEKCLNGFMSSPEDKSGDVPVDEKCSNTKYEETEEEEIKTRKLSIRCQLTVDEMLGTMFVEEDDIFATHEEHIVEQNQLLTQLPLNGQINELVSLSTRPDDTDHFNNFASFESTNLQLPLVTNVSKDHSKFPSFLSSSWPLLHVVHEIDETDVVIPPPVTSNVTWTSTNNSHDPFLKCNTNLLHSNDVHSPHDPVTSSHKS